MRGETAALWMTKVAISRPSEGSLSLETTMKRMAPTRRAVDMFHALRITKFSRSRINHLSRKYRGISIPNRAKVHDGMWRRGKQGGLVCRRWSGQWKSFRGRRWPCLRAKEVMESGKGEEKLKERLAYLYIDRPSPWYQRLYSISSLHSRCRLLTPWSSSKKKVQLAPHCLAIAMPDGSMEHCFCIFKSRF